MPATAAHSKERKADSSPSNSQAEMALLGGIIKDNAMLARIQDKVRGVDFFREDKNQKIYLAILRLQAKARAIDIVTIGEELHEKGHVEDIGGYGYLGQLLEEIPAPATTPHYADIVADLAIRRQLIYGGHALQRLGQSPTGPGEELLAKAQELLDRIKNGYGTLEKKVVDSYHIAADPEEFPYRAFPEPLQEYCQVVQRAKNAPSVFVGGAVLAAAAAVLGGARALQPKDDWLIYPNIWVALIGLSGDSKSPVLREVMKPVREIDFELEKANKDAEIEHAKDIAKWDRDRRDGISYPKPKATPPHMILVADITGECFQRFMESNPRGLTMFREEMSAWWETMNKYAPGGVGGDAQIYMSAYSNMGEKYSRVNLGIASLTPEDPVFSAIGGMQPSVLKTLKITKNFDPEREDGLRERLAYAFPAYRPLGKGSRSGVPHALRERWRDAIRMLWSLPMLQEQGRRPRAVPALMTEDAQKDLADWIDETRIQADRLYEAGDSLIRGVYLKNIEQAGKFTLITHFLRVAYGEIAGDTLVDKLDVAAGTLLADHYKAHARKALGVQRMTPQEHKAQQLLDWVLRGNAKSVLLSKITRDKPCGLRTKSDALAALYAMQDLGMGIVEKIVRTGNKTGYKFTPNVERGGQ